MRTKTVFKPFFFFPAFLWSHLRLFPAHLSRDLWWQRPMKGKAETHGGRKETHKGWRQDPRQWKQAKKEVGTKPPENPSSENPTTKITPQPETETRGLVRAMAPLAFYNSPLPLLAFYNSAFPFPFLYLYIYIYIKRNLFPHKI